ncbi:MAG: hypothetical protein J6I98_03770 [Clostridia bacterium]|nr:hypothetical protein [Clostridia bacterium]
MPYVQVRVSVPLEQDQIEKLKTEIGGAITLIPGKSDAVTMVEIVPGCHLYFGGNGDPCALVDVAANNSPDPTDLKAYSKQVCIALHEIAGIDMKRIYLMHHANPEWHTGRMFID